MFQVSVGDKSCTGEGPNKKLAKRSAAEAMLQMLGYSRPAPQPSKPAIKTGDTVSPGTDKKVTFLDADNMTNSEYTLNLIFHLYLMRSKIIYKPYMLHVNFVRTLCIKLEIC